MQRRLYDSALAILPIDVTMVFPKVFAKLNITKFARDSTITATSAPCFQNSLASVTWMTQYLQIAHTVVASVAQRSDMINLNMFTKHFLTQCTFELLCDTKSPAACIADLLSFVLVHGNKKSSTLFTGVDVRDFALDEILLLLMYSVSDVEYIVYILQKSF